jgi:hypothetical protein
MVEKGLKERKLLVGSTIAEVPLTVRERTDTVEKKC